jgi:hypothetical protein
MFAQIPDPDFLLIPDLGFRIPDPTRTKERRGKNFCPNFFGSHKFHKIVNYFIFQKVRKNCSPFTVRHVTGTGSGLLGGIPRVVVQISALT